MRMCLHLLEIYRGPESVSQDAQHFPSLAQSKEPIFFLRAIIGIKQPQILGLEFQGLAWENGVVWMDVCEAHE